MALTLQCDIPMSEWLAIKLDGIIKAVYRAPTNSWMLIFQDLFPFTRCETAVSA